MNLTGEKAAQKCGTVIFKKSAQSKQSPNGRKFAHSGHTVEAFFTQRFKNGLEGVKKTTKK
jgi:hypothetical protein